MDLALNILVVEDSEFQSEIFSFHLREMGLGKVTEAKDGIEALELLEKNSYDLILSDWEMPRMDGLQLLKQIRKTTAYKNIPFIMITILEGESANREVMDANASGFIVKPANAEVLREKLVKIFPQMKI